MADDDDDDDEEMKKTNCVNLMVWIEIAANKARHVISCSHSQNIY